MNIAKRMMVHFKALAKRKYPENLEHMAEGIAKLMAREEWQLYEAYISTEVETSLKAMLQTKEMNQFYFYAGRRDGLINAMSALDRLQDRARWWKQNTNINTQEAFDKNA